MRAALIALVALAAVTGQQFDVASVKPHAAGMPCGESDVLPGGRIVFNCFTLYELVREALDINREELAGGPEWVKTELWDITAKADGVQGELEPREFRARLRALVEERFHLKLRMESKQVSGFVLTTARTGRLGPRLTPNRGAAYRFDVRPGISLVAQRLSMADFAEWLKSPIGVGKRVENRTGLAGEYDIALNWTPLRLDGGGDSRTFSADAPTIFTAVQEQLGLKLRAAKVRGDVFVIEQVERPAPE